MRNFTQEKIGCHRHEFLRASCNASKASTPENARQLHSKFFSRNSVYDQQAKEHKESNERERQRFIMYGLGFWGHHLSPRCCNRNMLLLLTFSFSCMWMTL
jgi:hypothetical protein